MKKTLLSSFVVLSVSAFAAGGNNFSLHLTQDSTVEGNSLKPGDYKVSFDNGTATIKQGKQTIEVPAHEESEVSKYPSTSLVYQNDGKLSEVRFGGTHTKLIFDGDASVHTGQ